MQVGITSMSNNLKYCEIILIRWTFNFMYFVDKTIHEFNIPMKYLFTLVIFNVIEIHKFKCPQKCPSL